MERCVRMATNRYLWILALALAVALSTAAPASSAHRVAGVNAFVVRGLVSDGSVVGTTVDPNLVNAWGLAASADGSLVDCQRGHRDEHALRRNGAETGARGDRRRRPDRSRLQRHHRVRRDGRHRRRRPRASSTRARTGGFAAGPEAFPPTAPTPRRLRSTTLIRGPSIAGSPRPRRRTARRTSTRPTSTTDASTSSMPTGARSGGKARSSIAGFPPGTTSSGSRRSASGSSLHTHRLRLPTATTLPTGGYVDVFDLTRKVARADWTDGPAQPARRRRARAAFVREVRRRSARRQLRRRPHRRLPGAHPQPLGLSRRAADAGSARSSRSTACGGSSSATARSAGPREALYFTAGPHTWHDETEDEVGGLFGTDHACGLGRAGRARDSAAVAKAVVAVARLAGVSQCTLASVGPNRADASAEPYGGPSVVREVEVRNAEVEGAPHDRAARLQRAVVPKLNHRPN